VEAQLAAVDGALAALTAARVKQLLLITSSARHRERLAKHLRQLASKEAKFKQCALIAGPPLPLAYFTHRSLMQIAARGCCIPHCCPAVGTLHAQWSAIRWLRVQVPQQLALSALSGRGGG